MDKIVCLGKNYLEHAIEMGDAIPELPVLFLKPPSVICQADSWGSKIQVELPKGRGQIHPECEVVLRVGNNLKIEALTLGLDLTLRDVQAELKKKGHPWEVSKVFPNSAVLGPWIPASEFPNYLELPFTFTVEGQVRQIGKAGEMRLLPTACFDYIHPLIPLLPGDLIYTGTPKGVSAVSPGQSAHLSWDGKFNYTVEFV